MIKIRFDYCTVTIRDGWIQAPSPTITALLDALAATLPGYGSLPDHTIARGIIEKIGVGKIVRRSAISDRSLFHKSNAGITAVSGSFSGSHRITPFGGGSPRIYRMNIVAGSILLSRNAKRNII